MTSGLLCRGAMPPAYNVSQMLVSSSEAASKHKEHAAIWLINHVSIRLFAKFVLPFAGSYDLTNE